METLAARSDYEWGIDRDIVWIRDLDKGDLSVTNNIQNIVAYLNQHVPVKEYLLMYCDSMGTWDGLIFNGMTVNFFSINESDYNKAIQKIRQRAY